MGCRFLRAGSRDVVGYAGGESMANVEVGIAAVHGLGGNLTVWSELDAGTEVELKIPASRAYETSPAPRRSWLAEKLSGKETEIKP